MSDKPGSSLERVLSVLEVFTEERLEWTPEELMDKLGHSRPTLYRYLKTLKDAGFLVSHPNAGFTLGPKVVEMDYLLRKSDPLILNGQKQLDDLTAKYRCTALLARWYGKKLLCIASSWSTSTPLSSYPRGRPMPLGRGAIARSIVSFLPRRRLQSVIDQMFDDFSAVQLGNTREEIEKSFRKVRKKGFAVANSEVTSGVTGIAAPIFDTGQVPVASLCVTIAQDLVDDEIVATIGADVLKAAQTITKDLAIGRQQEHTV